MTIIEGAKFRIRLSDLRTEALAVGTRFLNLADEALVSGDTVTCQRALRDAQRIQEAMEADLRIDEDLPKAVGGD